MSTEQIGDVIRRCQKTGHLPDGSRVCLLCGSTCPDEPMFVGLWLPPKSLQRRLGCTEERLAKGGSRYVLYLICPDCMERPTLEEDVEVAIMKKASVQ